MRAHAQQGKTMIFAMVVCDYRTIYLPGVCDQYDWTESVEYSEYDLTGKFTHSSSS